MEASRNVQGPDPGGRVHWTSLLRVNSLHRLLLPLVAVLFGLISGCVFDVGISPSERYQQSLEDVIAGNGDTSPDEDVTTSPDATPDAVETTDAAQVEDASADAGPLLDAEPTEDSASDDTTDEDTIAGDAIIEDTAGDVVDDDSIDGGVVDDAGPTTTPTTGVWTVTFTETLNAGGLTLRPLGPRRGFTGVLVSPGGALRLEALP